MTMSNVSGTSNVSSSTIQGGNNDGVPRRCWCGEGIVVKLSKTDNNPYRRYFRCAHAAAGRRESDEKHVFKWMDEAVLNEIDSIDAKIRSLTEDLIASRMEIERMLREMDSTMLERAELAVVETKNWVKKLVVVVVILFMVGSVALKFVG